LIHNTSSELVGYRRQWERERCRCAYKGCSETNNVGVGQIYQGQTEQRERNPIKKPSGCRKTSIHGWKGGTVKGESIETHVE